jgi:hypothetical protein
MKRTLSILLLSSLAAYAQDAPWLADARKVDHRATQAATGIDGRIAMVTRVRHDVCKDRAPDGQSSL